MENKTVSDVSEHDLLQVYSLLKASRFSLPVSVTNLLENFSGDNHSTARSGCNDPFAIFGFLAFLLVLLQLLANNGGGRKKRSARLCSYHEESNQLREGRLAVHLVFQGFLNSLSEGRMFGILFRTENIKSCSMFNIKARCPVNKGLCVKASLKL